MISFRITTVYYSEKHGDFGYLHRDRDSLVFEEIDQTLTFGDENTLFSYLEEQDYKYIGLLD